MNTDDIDRLLGAHALDAVSDEERAEVDEALLSDPALDDEAREFRAVAALLAEAVSEPPPPGLRDRVMAEVSRTPQEREVVSLAQRRRRRRVGVLITSVAAVAIVLAGLGAALVSTTARANRAEELAAVLSDPDGTVLRFEGELAGSLRAVHSARDGRMVVVGAGVVDVAADRTYELWRLRDGVATKAALFRPDRDGDVELTIEVDSVDGTAWAITDEPRGGSEQPTTPVLAVTT